MVFSASECHAGQHRHVFGNGAKRERGQERQAAHNQYDSDQQANP